MCRTSRLYSFDNGKIINYQDNFKKLGDLPLAVYYDFETTTGSVVFSNAKDLETVMYNEPQQDLFEGESVLAAANKVFDFKKFQQNQSQKPENYKGKQLNNTETIDYADDLSLDDVLEKKNLKIAA